MTKEQGTKLCKHCKTEIPKGAKVCPNCRKKQGGIVKWIVIAVVVLAIISAATGGSDKKSEPQQASNTNTSNSNSTPESPDTKESGKESEKESEAPIEYIAVTATELSDSLKSNAMKAQNDYKGQYLEITGKLGNIDSNGKYIDIDSDIDFDFTSIQCYIKTDEQKQVIMEMSRGDAIVVRGYCKDIGEILGYSIDIDDVSAK